MSLSRQSPCFLFRFLPLRRPRTTDRPQSLVLRATTVSEGEPAHEPTLEQVEEGRSELQYGRELPRADVAQESQGLPLDTQVTPVSVEAW